MKIKYISNIIIAIILFLFITPVNLFSQNILRNTIQLQGVQYRQNERDLEIKFDVFLRGVEVSSNNQLILSPRVKTVSGKEIRLPEIIVNGKNKDNLYKRALILNGIEKEGTATAYQVFRADNKMFYQTIPYKACLDLTDELENASIYLIADLCGCGGSEKEHYEKLITEIQLEFPDYTPSVHFITPPKEPLKERNQVGEAYLVFEQAKSTIIPELLNNRAELQKIETSLKYIKEEPTAIITGLSIKAYASPEGTFEENLSLSKTRAKSLLDYLRSTYKLTSNVKIFSEGYGEDWDGLVKLIQSDSKVENKEQVLQIIHTVDIFDGREKQLMDLSGGRPYLYLLDRLFPLLRRSNYRIEYTVPSFELEKAKILLDAKPEMLSLEEMYRIAGTYERGSKSFVEVFDVARKLYPEDKIANLNAAAAAILKGNINSARAIFEKYESEPEAWNNLGIIYMQESRWEKADFFLRKAKEYGTEEAYTNLQILDKLQNAKNKKK